jgi:hypothetical protein
LKTGQRLGQDCGSKTCAESTSFCKRHLPKWWIDIDINITLILITYSYIRSE